MMVTQPRSEWAICHGDLPTNKTGGGGGGGSMRSREFMVPVQNLLMTSLDDSYTVRFQSLKVVCAEDSKKKNLK